MRPQRGSSSTLVVLTVAVVAGALLATPLVLMARQQGDRAEDAVGVIDDGHDLFARSQLDMALAAAEDYRAEHGTYAGFDASAASALEPSVRFTMSLTPAPGEVSIRVADDTSVLLVTATPGGVPLCTASSLGGASFGRVNAMRPADCAGGF